MIRNILKFIVVAVLVVFCLSLAMNYQKTLSTNESEQREAVHEAVQDTKNAGKATVNFFKYILEEIHQML